MSKDEIIEICNKRHNNKYDYSLIEFKKLSDKVKIICPVHNVFEQRLDSHKTSGCPKCNSNKLTNETFIEKAIKIHNSKYDYSLIDYKNSKTKVKIICIEHGTFELLPNSHLYKKRGCPKCSYRNVTTEMFIKKCKEVHGDRYNYSLVDYKNIKTKVKIICKIHGIFESFPTNHLNKKQNCGKCTGRYTNTEEFIEKSNNIHNYIYDYSLVNYKNSYTKIKIICKEHNKIFKQTPHDHLSGNRCPLCKESKGESEITIFLKNKNIKYITQYRFNNCKHKRKLPFDFYLPEYNTCIEYDGHQHFNIIEYWGGEKEFEKIKIRDKIKTEYCNVNNIKLLRIKYDTNVVDILNNFLL